MLGPLFHRALEQVTARMEALTPDKRAEMVKNLPSATERLAFLHWNARLSMTHPVFLEPCQQTYAGLMTWETLSDAERIALFVAGMEPLARAAAAAGLVGGVRAQ